MIKRTGRIICIFLVLFFSSCTTVSKKDLELNVMAWNIWGTLNTAEHFYYDGKSARERTVEIIKDYETDIVLMVETYGSAAEIAESLDFHYYTPDPKANLCIFSRYPLEDVGIIDGVSSFSFIRATACLPTGKKVNLYSCWIPMRGGRGLRDKSVANNDIISSIEVRDKTLEKFLISPAVVRDMQATDSIPMILGGDFNTISHLDFTKESAAQGLNYGRVLDRHPVMSLLQGLGFVDTYRYTNPKITPETLGYTWTTVGPEYTYVGYDNGGFALTLEIDKYKGMEGVNDYPMSGLKSRIDYLFSKGKDVEIVSSTDVTQYEGKHFPEFPSDHGGVFTKFKISMDKSQ